MSEITYDTNPIGVCDREIERFDELLQALGNEFVDNPNKEYLAPDLRQFLESHPQVKADIDHYIRHRLAQLRSDLHNQLVNNVNVKRIFELEERLKENSKWTMTAISTEK